MHSVQHENPSPHQEGSSLIRRSFQETALRRATYWGRSTPIIYVKANSGLAVHPGSFCPFASHRSSTVFSAFSRPCKCKPFLPFFSIPLALSYHISGHAADFGVTCDAKTNTATSQPPQRSRSPQYSAGQSGRPPAIGSSSTSRSRPKRKQGGPTIRMATTFLSAACMRPAGCATAFTTPWVHVHLTLPGDKTGAPFWP